MSDFTDELNQSVDEAIAFIDGKGPMTVHRFALPQNIREKAGITQAQMASLVGMDLPRYQEWETEVRRIDAPTASIFHLLKNDSEAVKRTLLHTS